MYTAEQKAWLEKVEELKREKGISQNEVGKLIGISGTTLSQLKNGKYPSDPQSVFDVIARYFGVKEKAKLTYSEIEYAPTYISTQVYSIISVCQVKGGLAVAAGDAGIGKTKAAQKFVADNPTNSILITVNPCLTGIKSLLKVVADKIGAAPERSRDELWFSIVKKLSDGMVLIFDEAQHLTVKEIETLRSFSDYFTSRGQTLGICFIGNVDTFSQIGSKEAKFAQISNRTKLRMIYSKSQVTRSDIVKLFPNLEEANMEREITLLHKLAQTPQAIRGVVNLVSNAYDNDSLNYEGLIESAKFMNMEV